RTCCLPLGYSGAASVDESRRQARKGRTFGVAPDAWSCRPPEDWQKRFSAVASGVWERNLEWELATVRCNRAGVPQETWGTDPYERTPFGAQAMIAWWELWPLWLGEQVAHAPLSWAFHSILAALFIAAYPECHTRVVFSNC